MLDDVPLAPLDRGEALELRGAAVLREARGVPGVDLDALADVVVAAGNLLLACPAVTALDVNSVLATADGAVAVDWKFSIDRPIGEVMDVGGADRRSRTAEVAHGLPGVRFTPGDSICAFYRGPGQRDDMPLPHLGEAIVARHGFICMMDDPDTAGLNGRLAAELGVGPARSRHLAAIP